MTELMDTGNLTKNACLLLKKIISIPSCTFEEANVADYLYEYLQNISRAASNVFKVIRIANNIVAIPSGYNKNNATLMLNAHIDTVKPAESYTINPFEAIEKEGIIYGLGSNDDGASVVALTQAFIYCNADTEDNPPYKDSSGPNVILVLSAEEERSGCNGISKVLEDLPLYGVSVDFAIIGEPTGMKAAVAERGLLVIDGTAKGVSGHAARDEGENALYKAIEDINILRNYRFTKKSPLMGDVKLTVTQINAGTVHNVVPDKCTFVVDIRPTEQYTNAEILELLQNVTSSELVARNLKNRSSATPQSHELIHAVKTCGIETFISPTTSDWMRLGSIPAIKIGPGDSARSHKADEFIHIAEIEKGIAIYIKLIETIKLTRSLKSQE